MSYKEDYDALVAENDRLQAEFVKALVEHPCYRLSKELEAENERLKTTMEAREEYHNGSYKRLKTVLDTIEAELKDLHQINNAFRRMLEVIAQHSVDVVAAEDARRLLERFKK